MLPPLGRRDGGDGSLKQDNLERSGGKKINHLMQGMRGSWRKIPERCISRSWEASIGRHLA